MRFEIDKHKLLRIVERKRAAATTRWYGKYGGTPSDAQASVSAAASGKPGLFRNMRLAKTRFCRKMSRPTTGNSAASSADSDAECAIGYQRCARLRGHGLLVPI